MANVVSLNDIIERLSKAMREAGAAGDSSAVAAIETQINRLRSEMEASGGGINGLRGADASLDSEAVRSMWAAVRPSAVHAIEGACILDCGERGSIAFVGGSVLFCGSVALEPKTALLLARHAKAFHGGGGTAFGAPEFLFNVAAANVAMGSNINIGEFKANSVRVQELARSWAGLLGESSTPMRHDLARRDATAAVAGPT